MDSCTGMQIGEYLRSVPLMTQVDKNSEDYMQVRGVAYTDWLGCHWYVMEIDA